MNRGTGYLYDAIPLEDGMPLSTLIFLLSKPLEASGGQAKVVRCEMRNGKTVICVEVKRGRILQAEET